MELLLSALNNADLQRRGPQFWMLDCHTLGWHQRSRVRLHHHRRDVCRVGVNASTTGCSWCSTADSPGSGGAAPNTAARMASKSWRRQASKSAVVVMTGMVNDCTNSGLVYA